MRVLVIAMVDLTRGKTDALSIDVEGQPTQSRDVFICTVMSRVIEVKVEKGPEGPFLPGLSMQFCTPALSVQCAGMSGYSLCHLRTNITPRFEAYIYVIFFAQNHIENSCHLHCIWIDNILNRKQAGMVELVRWKFLKRLCICLL